ncbi:unnamed protein product [Urochloa humidicola]
MPKLRSRGRKLHLVFDDSESGYTIRKLHLSPGSGEGSREGAMLPPVFAHISAPRGLPRLPYPPFRRHEVRSYAVAQHHGYIFVSTKSDAADRHVAWW